MNNTKLSQEETQAIDSQEFMAFMNKLASLKLCYFDRNTTTLRDSDDDFSVNYAIKVNRIKGATLPIGLTIHVHYKGQHVEFWGCENIAQIRYFTTWFMIRESAIDAASMTKDESIRSLGKGLFKGVYSGTID